MVHSVALIASMLAGKKLVFALMIFYNLLIKFAFKFVQEGVSRLRIISLTNGFIGIAI